MNWELIKVKQTNWIQDNSGYYTLIHWIDDNAVRLDVMDTDDMPAVNFQGSASDVRKESARWFQQRNNIWHLSFEHAAYIGSELTRCELLKTEYVQD